MSEQAIEPKKKSNRSKAVAVRTRWILLRFLIKLATMRNPKTRTRQPRNDQKIAKETMAEDVGNSMTAIQD